MNMRESGCWGKVLPLVSRVLCNDRDGDGTRTSRNDDLDPASVGIVAAPENGTATPNEDGTITYAPDKDYNGGDGSSAVSATMTIRRSATWRR
jgi:hypothetical protein